VVGKKKLDNIPQTVVSLMVINPMVAYLSKNHLLQSTNPSQGGLSPRVEQLLPRFFFQGKTTVDASEIPMPTNGWMFLKPCK